MNGMIGAWTLNISELLVSSGTFAVAGGSVLDEMVFGRLDRIWILSFLLLAIAAVIWGSRARLQTLQKLGDWSLIRRLVATVHRTNRTVNQVFAVVAVALIIGGLLRLQYGGVAKVRPTSGLDIVVAVDYSKSMLASDVFPSRSERLEAELQRFLDEASRRGDRVGVVVFAGAARGLPLTSDMRLLRMFLDKANPQTENPGGTAIGKALDLSLQFLLDARTGTMGAYEAGEASDASTPSAEIPTADQVIVLLTDGEDNASRPLELAERAAKLGVKIFTVGIGSTSGEPIAKFDENGKKIGFQTDKDGNYVVTRLDENTLRSLAERTKGRYVHVTPERFGLDDVLDSMSSLSRAQREDSVEILREEGFAFFIVPAFVLLWLTLLIPERRKEMR